MCMNCALSANTLSNVVSQQGYERTSRLFKLQGKLFSEMMLLFRRVKTKGKFAKVTLAEYVFSQPKLLLPFQDTFSK